MSIPTIIGQQVRQQLRTPYYGLVHLSLANLAYTDETAAHIANVYADLPQNIADLPPLPGPSLGSALVEGQWQLVWGPCVSRANANLMYAVSFTEEGATTPLFTVVSIRGTDTGGGTIGLFQQIIEDIDGVETVPFPVGAPVAIATGSRDGLNRLVGLAPVQDTTQPQAGNGDITAFLAAQLALDPTLPIVVTGHSLGGCQTTTVATYLKVMLPDAEIIPVSFAGPSAGTQAFADQFDAFFPFATQWWNTLDVVPNAFQDLPAGDQPSLRNIYNFWGQENPPGPGLSFTMKLLLDGVVDLYPKTYVQPTVGRQTLPGFVWVPPAATCKNDWGTQLLIQHFPPMYHCLISRQPGLTVAPYPLAPASAAPSPCTDVVCPLLG